MRVAMRVDASAAAGSGHVMRCLSLADALRARGDEVVFVSRDMPAHLAQWVAQHGHLVVSLPSGNASEPVDARQALEVGGPCAWMVVDHYGLGCEWEAEVRSRGVRLLAIDDLLRRHNCDVLLDQNLYADADVRYGDRIPAGCRRLLGPRHALLRAEFAQLHRSAQPRDGRVRRLLVFLGGMDAGNATEPVLQAVAATCPQDVSVDVVVGAGHPALARIRALAAVLPDGRCHVQTGDMAGLLAAADLAVGAGGTATWERCALGVPTLAVCIADNQRELLANASRAGVVCVPDRADVIDPAALAIHLRALLDNAGLRHLLSRRGLELVDGLGAQRVAAAMPAGDIVMRRADASDRDRLLQWRNHPSIRVVSREPAVIGIEEHRRWLEDVLRSDSRHLLIGERAGQPVGVVRFDVEGATAEVSIYLVPTELGRGSGAALLSAAEAWLLQHRPEVDVLRAQVQAANSPSHRLFERCGYRRQSTAYAKGIH